MRGCARPLGVVVCVVGLSWLAAGPGPVASAPPAVREGVLRLADAIGQKDQANANRIASELVPQTPFEDAMGLMKLRKQRGLGVGPAPATARSDDGIEAKLLNLAKRAPKPHDVQAGAGDWARAGYVTAAIARIAEPQCPVKAKQGKKDPASWVKWCQDMGREGVDFAAACDGKDPRAIQRAASKLTATCNACHADFKD